MKQGWEIKKLGEVCEYDKKPFKGSNLPYLGLEDIQSNTGQIVKPLEIKNVKSLTFCFTEEHVLYGRLRPYLNKVLLPNFEGHCSTEIFPIRPKKNVLHRDFLFHWLKWSKTMDEINATWTGATLPRANMNMVLEFNFPLPPFPEQQRIVSILDEAFEAIATAKANAEQNLKNAKELFESYLQGVFEKKGEGWKEKRFDEICVLQRGFDLPTQSRNEGQYPLVSSNGITDRIDLWKVKSPGVVTGRSGTIGNVHFVDEDFWPLNTALYIKEFHGNFPRFIFYFIKQFDLGKYSSGAGVPTLNRNNVHSEMVWFPKSISEQQTIVAKLDELSVETKRLETIYQQKIADLEELKKSLLQKAFNGELKSK